MLASKVFFHCAAALLWSEAPDEGLFALVVQLDAIPVRHKIYALMGGTPEEFERGLRMFSEAVTTHRAWNNALYYASLIKAAKLRAASFQDGILPLLSALVPDQSSILCSLRELHWDQGVSPNDDLLYLVGPNLKYLTVDVMDFRDGPLGQEAFAGWAERLARKLLLLSPSLHRLYIRAYKSFGRQHTPFIYFSTLHRLPVDVRSVSKTALRRLPVQDPSGTFTQLKQLWLNARTGASGVFEGLANVRPLLSEALRCVTVLSDSAAGRIRPTFLVYIAPLLSMAHLNCVTIRLPGHVIAFDGDALLRLAWYWPSLECLDLDFRHHPSSPLPTLNSLLQFAQSCPSLRELSLPVMNGSVEWSMATRPPANTNLFTLVIRSMYITQGVPREPIVIGLRETFPSMRIWDIAFVNI
ncbi:hypothetical protein BV20DRAFT_1057089 [Pilatotrama ljubarskyi]|nr:hypothetical protein BV20DRAFT_1057089 [Pilatotrama ljubarskyi]